MNHTKPLCSIQQLSIKLNIPKPTLRFWEKELEDFLIPLRTRGGQRRYTPEHVSIIEEIKKLKNEGASLAEIRSKLRSRQLQEAGSRIAGDEKMDRIDLLVERVAGAVKIEVLKFFERSGE